ncbi:1,2-phenylacetyl-CoA epoxidase subunit PaaC [Amphiplicatus metriothermophilus]|uniref:Ring-1,2-phenylacetyl-CoA epoxidase subunit PaaC n=1 Tax=Amphiplicatus metriothermophilus TaxID=1519374 RepID=A0A239PVA1_9PROT|nr:1,2-phenylacetyl-CoA epoxidase subunit PaaC [Amphiplicatus metriothermophilus]MBB5519666.1 ring-1,2-phenylacetyl-CoA epoxidase subunit PaaC [Amphiplicatus metriothermophilus]SNT74229.1 ring-1,2-phenylacetyl-CoA epoxidase subunit PaaC [Amphiplicatus metriothermophilus]
MSDAALEEFALRMGDNCLILGQRVSAWCGYAPALEEDIAMANVALDLIGQAKLWLALAGALEGKGRDADALAFLRDARAFRNCLLVEQPNGDYGQTLMRQFLFDAWHVPMLEGLAASREERVAAIAAKTAKEAAYHRDRSADLVIRLGDGGEESRRRMQTALDLLWPFAGELLAADETEARLAGEGVIPDLADIAKKWTAFVEPALEEATLVPPKDAPVRKGGKQGLHTEALGYVLAEMQWLQRAYPGATW